MCKILFFWEKTGKEEAKWATKVRYPHIGEEAVRHLLPFASTYLCETAFSSLTYLKNKYRTKLDVENDLRLALTKIEPRINLICESKQSQPSH